MLNDKNLYLFLVAQQLRFSVGFLVFQGLDYTNKLIAIFLTIFEIN